MHDHSSTDPSTFLNPPVHHVSELEARLDRLAMLCCAMWTVIQAHTDATDGCLNNLVRDLDLSDGFEDGRANEKQVAPCKACGRPVHVARPRCQYCGAPRQPDHPFQGVL